MSAGSVSTARRELIRRGETLAESKDPAVVAQLHEIREFYEFLEGEYAGIIERWEQRRRRR